MVSYIAVYNVNDNDDVDGDAEERPQINQQQQKKSTKKYKVIYTEENVHNAL